MNGTMAYMMVSVEVVFKINCKWQKVQVDDGTGDKCNFCGDLMLIR